MSFDHCNYIKKSEIDNYISGKIQSAKKQNIAIVLVGGPGSGKSTTKTKVLNILKKAETEFVNLNPDEILEKYFGNNRELYDKCAPIYKRLYEEAMTANANVIVDRTGSDFNSYFEDVIKKLKTGNYDIHLVIVNAEKAKILDRIKKRAQATGRAVNETYMNGVYDNMKTAIPKYVGLDCEYIKTIFLFDNTNNLKLAYKTSCTGDKKELECVLCDKITDSKIRASLSRRRTTVSRNRRKTSKNRGADLRRTRSADLRRSRSRSRSLRRIKSAF